MTAPTVPYAELSERSVLAAAMVNPQAFARAASVLSVEDFYPEQHREIWSVMCRLRADGVPVEPSVVLLEAMKVRPALADTITRLDRSQVSANLDYHLAMIERAAIARELQEVTTRAAQLAQGASLLDPEDDRENDPVVLAENAIEALRGVQRMRTPVTSTTVDVLDLIDRVMAPADWVIPGCIARGERIIVTAPEGYGKLLRLDEPIPTPVGWTLNGSLRVGDEVLDRFGTPCTVLETFRVDEHPDVYTLVFSDGERIDAGADHQWITVDYAARQGAHKPAVRTTVEIRDTLTVRNGHCVNHAVPVAAALDLPEANLPIPPYLVGAWLGDGTTSDGVLTLNRDDANSIQERILSEGRLSHRVQSGERPGSVTVRLPGFRKDLRSAGLMGDKHIPLAYLRASLAQRRALLAGLMDTDGSIVPKRGPHGWGTGAAACELTLTCKRLVDGAVELIRTLGIKPKVTESEARIDGRYISQRWRITFQADVNPFSTPRKADRWEPMRTRRALYRYITAVIPAESVPMRCIMVDSPDHSYLAGRAMIPTHNSTFLRQLAGCVAGGLHPFKPEGLEPRTVLHIDAENPESINVEEYGSLIEYLDALGHCPRPGRLMVEQIGPTDVLDPRTAAHLLNLAERVKPDLILIGPLYQLHDESPNDEGPAKKVASFLVKLRDVNRSALVVEAHTPHSDGPSGQMRRPFGASLWKRWPEFGYFLGPDPDSMGGPTDPESRRIAELMRQSIFSPWRGNRGRAREWPRKLEAGSRLPWQVSP